ncbi:MAG: GNAT family N-acetyltransferase [Armatimonadetes bacterium]|nr:GNAT family N-acetyltransferase [Armatimonadota bacterium]
MREIRPIKMEEAEAFLSLLCNTFAIDFERAYAVFFNEPLFDVRRKWALFENGKILSILSTVPLEFGWGRGIGVAGVATAFERRGEGLASELLNEVMRVASEGNEGATYLFARELGLYERNGFRLLDTVIRVGIVPNNTMPTGDSLIPDKVAEIYDRWALGHPDRLQRPVERWAYWRWTMKLCMPFGSGYMCTEGGVVRECISSELLQSWPVPRATDWLGLTTMARQMGVPMSGRPRVELYLMGKDAPSVPQMFMTDQF